MQFLILFNQKSPLKFIENASNNKKFTINRMHLSHYLVILAQANCRERSVNSQYSWEYCWPRIVSPSCSASQPKLVHDASHFFDQSELDMYFFNFMTSSFFTDWDLFSVSVILSHQFFCLLASAVLPVIGQGGNGLWWISYCWEAFSINLRGDFWLNKMRNCTFL